MCIFLGINWVPWSDNIIWDGPVSGRSVSPSIMVLFEALQAEKGNAYTDYVSIPVRINHWTFNGRKSYM